MFIISAQLQIWDIGWLRSTLILRTSRTTTLATYTLHYIIQVVNAINPDL